MAISRVSAQDTFGSGTGSVVITFPTATKPGNLLLVAVYQVTSAAGGVTAPADWTLIKDVGIGLAAAVAEIALFAKTSTGDTGVTITGTAAQSLQALAYEYQGGASIAVDASNSGTSGNTNVLTQATGSATSTVANGLAFLVGGCSTSGAPPYSWTTATALLSGSFRLAAGEQILGATGAKSDTFHATGSHPLSAFIVLFKPATAVTDAETGTGVDDGSISASFADAESGAGVDAGESVAAAFTDDNPAVGVDAEGSFRFSGEGDTGTGADTEAIDATFTDTETGVGVDNAVELAAVVDDDEAVTSDDGESIEADLSDNDAAMGVEGEVGILFIPETDDDTGTADDAGESIDATVVGAELGVGNEGAALIIDVIDDDSAVALDGDSEFIIPVSADIVVDAHIIDNPTGIRMSHARIHFSTSYVTGGHPLLAATVDLRYINFAVVLPRSSSYEVQWVNSRILVFDPTTGLEVDSGTDLSLLAADVVAYQLESPTWDS